MIMSNFQLANIAMYLSWIDFKKFGVVNRLAYTEILNCWSNYKRQIAAKSIQRAYLKLKRYENCKDRIWENDISIWNWFRQVLLKINSRKDADEYISVYSTRIHRREWIPMDVQERITFSHLKPYVYPQSPLSPKREVLNFCKRWIIEAQKNPRLRTPDGVSFLNMSNYTIGWWW